MDVNNQGLNLPSNLQNLDVRNELLSKEVGSGASCAYSLRDLTGSNKKAVRVRREPHDETNSIDDERIFGGQEVQAGYLEDWVNGKLENTLPCDVDTASAGYSLRKIKSSYTGNAVRIRRSSDEIEVDVAFDSNNKVSASSAITNLAEEGGESGQTTATTLGEFINHSGDFGNFRVDDEWSDNLLAFSSVGKTSFSVEAKSLSGFNSTDTVRVSAPITKVIAEPQASVTKFKTTFTIDSISGEGNGNATDGALYVKGANSPNGNGSWNFHNSPDGTGGNETFKFTSAGTYTVEGYGEDETDAFNLAFRTFSFIIYSGTKVSVSNVSMEVLNNCTVHTWYDQTKDLTELSTYFNATLSSSNIAVNAMTEEFGTFLGRDNAVKLTSTAGNTQRFDSIDFGIGAGESVRFTAQIYVPSTNTALDSFAYSEKFDVSGYDRKQGVITPAQDQWVDIDFNYVQSDDTVQRIIFWNSASTTPTANNNSDGDVIYFRNMVVTRVTKGQADAVQDTSGSQPKIAENGALLADGIDFDGSNDFLQTSTQVLTGTETGANSMYAVLKQTTGDAGYICGSASSQSGSDFVGQSLYGNNADSVFILSNGNNIDKPERDNITITQGSTVLVSANYSNNNTNTLNKNANNDGYANGDSAYDFNAGSKFTIGARDGSTATAVMFDGTIQEIIAYDSDQSDNRFKIESNINNYYSLYNDANEITQSTWQNDGSEGTFTSNSLDGFSYQNSSSSAFIGVTLSNTLALNDSVFVSFNATGVTYPGSSDQSPQLRLRDGLGSGSSGTSSISHVTNGFNSFTLTYNTGSSGQHIVFSEGNTAGGTVTISNFKVSRIARNGFVETWYDQSGNGFDLKSQSADTQPFVVNNGGFTGGVYSPSRLNNSTKQYLEISDPDFDSTNITSSKFGWLAVMANMEENDGSQAGGVILGNTRNTQSFPAGAIALTLSDTNPNGRMFVTNLKTGSTGDFIGAVDNDDLFTSETIGTAVVDGSSLSTFLNGTTGSGTFTNLTLTSDVHFKIFQASDSGNNVYYQNSAQGFIKELIFMQGDTIDDIATIRNEVNNHYNIF